MGEWFHSLSEARKKPKKFCSKGLLTLPPAKWSVPPEIGGAANLDGAGGEPTDDQLLAKF